MVVVAEYIWLDAKKHLRSKTKVIHSDFGNTMLPGYGKSPIKTAQELARYFPNWNYDGSSTGQAEGLYSELLLEPVAVYNNPFMGGANHVLVLCETTDKDGNPLESNCRAWANKLFLAKKEEEPWFGIEQEYFILGKDYQITGNEKQGRYYCSVGAQNTYYRKIAERHMEACIGAGLQISGINAEVAPCQWEYQIGPCEGITSGDELWVSRYLLERVAEMENAVILYHPKPWKNINGSGCHTNYSTNSMREEGGLEKIYEAIDKLSKKHMEHMEEYGEENEKRMSGEHETSQYEKFSFNKERPVDRGASVRVGYETIKNGRGYFEDRRPASTMDPYLVTSKIFETTVLE